MRRRYFGASLLALAGCGEPPSAPGASPVSWELHPVTREGADWRLVAQSDLIVRAKVSVLPQSLEDLPPRFVQIPLVVTSVLSGTEDRKTFDFTYYTSRPDSPSPTEVAKSVSAESIFHLKWIGRSPAAPAGAYFFAGYQPEALVPASAELEARIREEAETQRTVATRVEALLSAHKPPLDRRVASLVDKALRGNTQAALDGLLALPNDALPAMVKRLDDRRPLKQGANSISIKGVWEFSHYSVVDIGGLMMFVLHHHGDLKNGYLGWADKDTSERRRERIVAAWRVWLGYSLRLMSN